MNIPDKAVEAAAIAAHKASPDDAVSWDRAGLHLRCEFRDQARAALEAAAPHIAAQENLDIALELPGLTHAQAEWLAKRRGDPLWQL